MKGRVFASLCAALAALGLACGAPAQAATHRQQVHHLHRRVDRSLRAMKGKASYYAAHLTGRKTASGKRLKATRLTAASKTLPLGTKAKVTNLETGKSVKVTVTDRGPYKKGRIADVSREAATRLGMKKDGVAEVRVTPLKLPAPAN